MMIEFLYLPGEVRNMIYEKLISTGEMVSMMRTCGQVCREMSPLVDLMVPCRMYVNYGDSLVRSGLSLPRERLGRVGNVEIHWLLPCEANGCGEQDRGEQDREDVLVGLDPLVGRRRCVLYLERSEDEEGEDDEEEGLWVDGGDVLRLRSKLVGFDEVEVRVRRSGERRRSKVNMAGLELLGRALTGLEETVEASWWTSGVMVRLGGSRRGMSEDEMHNIGDGCFFLSVDRVDGEEGVSIGWFEREGAWDGDR